MIGPLCTVRASPSPDADRTESDRPIEKSYKFLMQRRCVGGVVGEPTEARKDKNMKRIVAVAAVSAAFAISGAAEAHSSRHHTRHHGVYRQMWNAPVAMYQNRGPRWSQPNECYTDLGYGRFESCDR
jgi:hypothetical protein